MINPPALSGVRADRWAKRRLAASRFVCCVRPFCITVSWLLPMNLMRGKRASQFSPAQRTECVRLVTLGGGPSYVELLTCLELAKHVKELPAADPNGNGGEPIEKFRHIK